MLASNDRWGQAVTSRLKKISPRLASIFYGSNYLQTMTSRLKKIFPLVTYIFLNYLDQQSVRSIDGTTKKIYTSYVFLLKAKIDLITSIVIKKMVVVGGIFS
jgi:hypothetical protein